MSVWWGSGFITQLIYAAQIGADLQQLNLISEDNLDLLTEDSTNIQVEN